MKIIALVFALLSVTNVFACAQNEIAFPQSQVCADLKWVTGPSQNAYNSVSVHLDQSALKLNVIPWMVMMGHEHGSRPVTITTVSPNDYLVEKIYFMGGMMGDWYLRFQLVNDKKEVVEEVRSLVTF